jgi:hypothetical protein
MPTIRDQITADIQAIDDLIAADILAFIHKYGA